MSIHSADNYTLGKGIVYFNQKYLKKFFSPGTICLFSGKPEYKRELQMINPSYEILNGDETDYLHTGRIVPILILFLVLPGIGAIQFIQSTFVIAALASLILVLFR